VPARVSSLAFGGSAPRTQEARPGPFRAHARVSVRLPALFTHVAAGWQTYAQIENIGLGGARVSLDRRVVEGEAVTLAFGALGAPTLLEPVVLRARVAWVAPGGPLGRIGVAFRPPTPATAFALYELIAAALVPPGPMGST